MNIILKIIVVSYTLRSASYNQNDSFQKIPDVYKGC